MAQFEPGVDRHMWESRLAALDEELLSDPSDALPEMLALVEEMRDVAGRDTSAPGSDTPDETDLVLDRARELVERREAGEEVPNDDAFQAAGDLRALSRVLVAAPGADAGSDLR